MTKKKNEKTAYAPNKISFFSRLSRFLKSEQTHFVIGLCSALFGVYLMLAFISFFFTGAADQSRLENLSFGDLSSVKNEITNWTGAIGAYLSNLIINKWTGISSFVLCIFFFCIGLKWMKIRPTLSVTKTFFYTCACLIWGSIFFGFFFISGYDDTFIYLGGMHGYYTTLLLEANIGWFGTLLLIVLGFLLFMILVSKRTVPFLQQFFRFGWLRFKKHTPDNEPVQEETEKNTPQEPQQPAKYEPQDPGVWVEQPLMVEYDTTTTPMEKEEKEGPVSPSEKESTFEVIQPQSPLFTPPASPQKEEEKEIEMEVITHEEEPFDGQELGEYDPTLDLSHYKYPTFDLLNQYDNRKRPVDMEEQNKNKNRIIETLEHYGIKISSIIATVGPTITLYEIVPEPGIRISKIKNLEDDIALSLAALGIRIIAPIPGKGTIGIEVPNKDPQIVPMQSIIASQKFQECKYDLPIALGKTITDEIFITDLCKMPHILVAGATGQGKSVGLNAIITSLLYKKHPSQLKFVLVDPKKVEFNIYASIERHFLAKLPDAEEAIITDVTKVVQTLNSITKEMDNRYDLLKKAHTRNIKEYNAKFIARKLNPNNGHRYMPYIVVIIDEFGDLIMTAGKEVELPIARIAQLARAVGIHMIIATQRPSTNIITGIIKANFPARVAFRVSSMIDSRTILDCPGANQLIGRGDLLFSQGSDLIRVQCAFVDTPEIEDVCNYIGEQAGYPTAYLLPEYVGENGEGEGVGAIDLKERDPMFEEAARLIVANQQGSTSLIQRKFSIGYNRAGRIMDQLEAAGIVGPFEGSKARQVLVMDDMHLDSILENLR